MATIATTRAGALPPESPPAGGSTAAGAAPEDAAGVDARPSTAPPGEVPTEAPGSPALPALPALGAGGVWVVVVDSADGRAVGPLVGRLDATGVGRGVGIGVGVGFGAAVAVGQLPLAVGGIGWAGGS